MYVRHFPQISELPNNIKTKKCFNPEKEIFRLNFF